MAGRAKRSSRRPGYRNYPFAGWLVQRDLGKKGHAGHGGFLSRTGRAWRRPRTRPATLIDIGGYYKFRDPGFQLLFCYGHSVVGQTENYGYLGLYWTWGKDDKAGQRGRKTGPGGFALNGIGPPGLMGHIEMN